ncbi:MAG: signal peptidase II [Lutibacter sp.]|nr:MAG: signal peptidase II [Lutibacter sp.]
MKNKRIILIVLVVLFSIGCDQVSKSVARNNINDNEIIHILKDNLAFTNVENNGAAFGLGVDSPLFLKIFYLQLIPISILLFLFRMIVTDTEFSKLTIIGTALVIGGAFGNILDRMLYRSVTDFIKLNIGVNKTIIFNVADILVVLGMFLVIVDLIINYNKKKVSS